MSAGAGITNLLVTGPPGCGKSTLVLRVLKRIQIQAGGFTTAEIRGPGGGRVGFRITGLSGAEGILAHRTIHDGPRVGRYRVNIGDLESIGVAEITRAIADPSVALIVVDEIARMELFSEKFRNAVGCALDSRKPLLGAIQMRRDPFLDRIRGRSDTTLIHITRGKLDAAENRILPVLTSLLG